MIATSTVHRHAPITVTDSVSSPTLPPWCIIIIIIKLVSGKIGCRKRVAPNQKSIKLYSPMNTTSLTTVLINFPLNVNNGKLE